MVNFGPKTKKLGIISRHTRSRCFRKPYFDPYMVLMPQIFTC